MSRWLRRLGFALATLVVVIVVLSGFVYMKSSSMLTKKYVLPVKEITVVKDSATIERGKHLATTIAKCTDCHTSDFGGKIFIDDPALGLVVAPNITTGQGGHGKEFTDAQMAAIIRNGIKADSTSALVMPSDDYQHFSDDDVAAIVAYVRSMPPVNRTLATSMLRPVGRALSAFGQLPIFMAEATSHTRSYEKSVAPDTTVAYGSYLANVGGCTGCHGPGLSGGKIPGTPPEWPPAANITPAGIGRYTDEQIKGILTTGIRPDGTHINNVMPWEYTKSMTPDEFAATIKYLRTVPPKEFGHR